MNSINQYIDHTLLKPTATESEISELCEEAVKYDFYAVCINSSYIPLVKEKLEGSKVKICSVVGFPLGAMSSKAKLFETQQALADGADEIDMVINVGFLKSGNFSAVEEEIELIKKAVETKILKVILETCFLTPDEIMSAASLAVKAGADYVKTSTGFGSGGATFEAIELMQKAINGKAKIKASGGIKNLEIARKFIEMGVERIGTSSGVSIIKELKK